MSSRSIANRLLAHSQQLPQQKKEVLMARLPRLQTEVVQNENPAVRFGLALSHWSERWFPDPLVFALLGIVVVFIVGLLLHENPSRLAIQGGKNFWALVPFTMQMVMIIIGGGGRKVTVVTCRGRA